MSGESGHPSIPNPSLSTSEQGEGRPRQGRSPITGQYLRIEGDAVAGHEGHGLRKVRVPPEFLAVQQQFLAAALVDEGEREADVPVRRRSLLEYRSVLHRQVAQLDAAFREQGQFDKRGRLRCAWLSQLTALIGRAESLDRLLGLARRTKQVVIPSPEEWIADTPMENEVER